MRPEAIKFPHGLPVNVFARCIEEYPYHWHNTLEILQVLKGTVNLTIGDDNLQLSENSLVIVNIGELHRITPSQDNEILFIQIDADFYRRLLPEDRYIFIYCCSTYHEAESPGKYKELREHIARLANAFNISPGEKQRKDIEIILTTMLSYITYHFDFLRWGYGTKPFDEKFVERLHRMAKRINRDSDVTPALKELAAELNISHYHLSHDLRKKLGSTFLNFVYYSRCEHAAKLLLSTHKRILDIALECGFSDPKYLIKHFKQFFKCTPSQFRERYQADNSTLVLQARYHDLPPSVLDQRT